MALYMEPSTFRDHIKLGKPIPEDVQIAGKPLDLRDMPELISLPNGLSVDQLCLSNCTSLKALPKKLHISQWLDLCECTALESLPDDLIVGRWIGLAYTTIILKQGFPKGMTGVVWVDEGFFERHREYLPLFINCRWALWSIERQYRKHLSE